MAEPEHDGCIADRLRDCSLHESTLGKLDAVAGLRIMISALSVLGTLSIILSAVHKKQVLSPKVFPIFVLSIADLLLAVLWIAGSLMWLVRGNFSHRAWCFATSVPTIILECVSINLTLVYAWLAYGHINKRVQKKMRSYSSLSQESKVVQRQEKYMRLKIKAAYIVAWMMPVVLVLLSFGIIAKKHNLVAEANHCSCWCIPGFGNVVPFGFTVTPTPAMRSFLDHMHHLFLSYGVIVGLHYFIVFTLLVAIYIIILRKITKLKDQVSIQGYRGKIVRHQSQARKRIVMFLTVFICTGLANLLVSVFLVWNSAVSVEHEAPKHHHHLPIHRDLLFDFYYIQSICLPLQGFLNAIVYGWTREDFVEELQSQEDCSHLLKRGTNSLKYAALNDSVQPVKDREDSNSVTWRRGHVDDDLSVSTADQMTKTLDDELLYTVVQHHDEAI